MWRASKFGKECNGTSLPQSPNQVSLPSSYRTVDASASRCSIHGTRANFSIPNDMPDTRHSICVARLSWLSGSIATRDSHVPLQSSTSLLSNGLHSRRQRYRMSRLRPSIKDQLQVSGRHFAARASPIEMLENVEPAWGVANRSVIGNQNPITLFA